MAHKSYLFLVLLIFIVGCKEEPKVAPIPEVGVIKAENRKVPIVMEFVGEIRGKSDIPIRARVDGFLEKIAFSQGQKVTKGQLLYVIDDQPFLAELASAKSELAAAKTDLVKAINDLNRIQPLADMKAVSQTDLDAAIASKGAAEAMVDAAKAKIDLAQIKLSYTRIMSPINGTIGKTLAKAGEYVGKSPNPVILNTVSRTDTVELDFFLSENQYLEMARQTLGTSGTGDSAASNRENKLELVLSDGTIHPYPGKFDFIDRNVNSSTGSILVQASFPNEQNLIRPGQYGRMRYTFVTNEKSILVPKQCVMETQGQFSVYIVSGEKKIESKTIGVFGSYQDYYIVNEGLTGNESIVLEGLQKVKPGAEVTVVETEFKSRIKAE
ncbi:MAG: efflux RND transporter periplasmic adaptor subunit [Crocinitomicaceae bacterium]